MLPHAYTHSKSWFKNQDLFKYPREVLGNIQLKNAECFSQLAMLVDALQKLRTPGMTIFLKSSNSVGLSKVEPC